MAHSFHLDTWLPVHPTVSRGQVNAQSRVSKYSWVDVKILRAKLSILPKWSQSQQTQRHWAYHVSVTVCMKKALHGISEELYVGDQYAQLHPHQSSRCLVLKWTLKALWSWRVNMRAVPSRCAARGLIPSTEEGDKRESCTVKSWAWQHIPAISALWSMRQKDEIFKASLGYIPLKQQNYSLFLIRHSVQLPWYLE